ncbi:KH domain-containing protein At1g09660/At1g09670-like [Nicotiana tabacum]|uniref:KH domain-containing protein At1g09660/At1g09670-like n=1 Tax=Nicotiana tabacum TaxID=4097 RepID=A0A1S4CB44_TOBAC|nr:KH domain-containing protein At1g09660/At1g09670 [Nicotiana tomentosiformis]XP_016498341.1 PREDICTED: KH domain-containing protein At1g09660/At1g09670-like [Nicotiana tabacum]
MMNMENRIHPGSYFQYSPTGIHAPLQRSSSLTDRERYLADLLGERQKLGPFMQILPVCSRLLNQEIMRASALLSNQFVDQERMGQESPHRSFSQQMNGGQINVGAWSAMQTEENRLLQKMAPFQPSPLDWHVVPGTATTPVVKKVIRLDVPVEKFPNFNFVGRILGPRGNSLKRVEAITECRVYIRGQGSVKDSIKEEKLKDKPGYEHLKEPLHLLVEAEFPEDIIDARIDHAVSILENLLKPVDESMDVYKKQQLRELAMLNGTLREESPSMSPRMSPSMSPFSNTGMKRAKTGR